MDKEISFRDKHDNKLTIMLKDDGSYKIKDFGGGLREPTEDERKLVEFSLGQVKDAILNQPKNPYNSEDV